MNMHNSEHPSGADTRVPHCRLATLPRYLLVIIVVSVLARLVVALYLGDVVDAPPLLTDQRSYHALGVRLLEGHGYSFDRHWYPFTPADEPTAHWSFLYPLFVAAVYAVFGVHPLAARLVQAVLGGILLPWVIYRLADRLLRSGPSDSLASPWRHVPLIAAALTAIYGYFVLYAATLMTETFYITALVWSLERSLALGRLLRSGERVPMTLTVQFGLSLVVATLLRQSFLPWVPVLFLWLLGQARFKLRWASLRPLVLSGVLLLLGIAPWTIRNYIVYGRFLLLNSNTGYAMYSAQHPLQGTSFHEFEAMPLPDDLEGTNEAEWDHELLIRGVGFVVADPGRYLLLSLSRVRAFFEFWPTADSSTLNNIGRMTSFGLFLPFILYGLYLSIKRSPETRAGRSLLYLFMIVYSIVHILTWAMVRYRLPVDIVGLVFAAFGIADVWSRLRGLFGRLGWYRTPPGAGI